MKDLNLMFNVSNPSMCHIIEAGRSIKIEAPGTYNIVPMNLDKIVAGYTAPLKQEESPSLLELSTSENEKPIAYKTLDTKIEPLFTKNLSDLLQFTRTQ